MSEFRYRITDDSMSGDRIYTGDLVLLRETSQFQKNDICAVINDRNVSQLLFRRVEEKDNGYLLMPSNPRYASELKKEISIIGIIKSTHMDV